MSPDVISNVSVYPAQEAQYMPGSWRFWTHTSVPVGASPPSSVESEMEIEAVASWEDMSPERDCVGGVRYGGVTVAVGSGSVSGVTTSSSTGGGVTGSGSGVTSMVGVSSTTGGSTGASTSGVARSSDCALTSGLASINTVSTSIKARTRRPYFIDTPDAPPGTLTNCTLAGAASAFCGSLHASAHGSIAVVGSPGEIGMSR